MGRCSCCLMVIILVGIIVADALLFAYFIGQFGMRDKQVTTGDMVSIENNLSTFWCDGVTLTSSLKFDAYQLETLPMIRDGYHEDMSYDLSGSFSRFEYRLYKFYLLEDSTLKISVCSSEPVALVSVFSSEEDVTGCLSRRALLESDEDDYEDLKCSNTVISSQIMVESSCESSQWSWWRNRKKGMDVANIRAYNDGYYYILVQNFYYYGANEIRMELNLSRTVYNVRQSEQSCVGAKKCYLGYDFWSQNSVVVRVPPATGDEQLISTSIHYACDLNEIILILVFLVAPCILFLFVCCSYCCFCKEKKVKHKIYVKKQDENKMTESLLRSIDVNSEDNSVFNSDYGSTSTKAFNHNVVPQAANQRPGGDGAATAPAFYPYPPAYAPPANPNLPPSYAPVPPNGPAPPYTYRPS